MSNLQKRRRQFLKATGGAITTVGLAGCAGGSGGDGGDGSGGDGGGGGGGDGDGGDGGMDDMSFDDLVAAAEEEGEVTVFATASGAEVLDQAFQEEYDITVNRTRQGSTEVGNQILQGHQAGSQRVDLAGMTLVPVLMQLGDQDALAQAPQVVQDELEDVTIWHQDKTAAEAFVKRNLLWLHNSDIVNDPPTTWNDMVNSGLHISVNNEDPEMLLVYEEVFGQDEARQMIRDIGEVGTITTSHGGAGQETAQGEYDMGLLMHKFMKIEWGQNLAYQPKTHNGTDIPMTATPSYLCKPVDSPNPNAGWLYFQWLCKNQATVMEEQHTFNQDLDQTWYAANEGHEVLNNDPNARLVTWDLGPQLGEYLDIWKDLVGATG